MEAVQAWVSQKLGGRTISLEALSGDAGFRRYFRVTGAAQPVMAVYAPPATENTPLYLTIFRLLADGGVRVPQVLATDLTQGFLLVEDCGDQLLLPLLNDDSVEDLYGKAMQMLVAIQAIAVPADTIGVYDQQRLWDEMALFPRWFVQDLLDLPFGRNEQVLLENFFEQLVDNALEQPQVLVHRDYHSRNLMLKGSELVTIDFQDAVTGPFTYDLVSLLRDCYIHWQPQQVEKLAIAYRKILINTGKTAGESEQQFLRWFDLMGLQRHIKVLGIFARLWLRDGKAGYLNDLPLVLHYTLEVACRYPESADFVEWMQVRVLPACQRQSWWKPLP